MMNNERLRSLDLLRGIAVVFVIGRHLELCPTYVSGMSPLLNVWQRGGWVGVDLFFVLSGFLVSGLLFREFTRSQSIQAGRFLLRRGLKIYPAFYCFLGLSLLMLSIGQPFFTHQQVLGEAFFLQNYLGRVWLHTWSLAVEEHFYLGITILIGALIRIDPQRSLRFLPVLLCILLIVPLVLRWLHRDALWVDVCYPTHLRIDSLVFGVMLSYVWHFYTEQTRRLVERHWWAVFSLGLLLLTPPFFWPLDKTPALYTFGFTGLYLGAGLLLLALLVRETPANWSTGLLSWVGMHSYSIYLWHLPVLIWFVPIAGMVTGLKGAWPAAILGVIGSVVVGVGMSRLVESPVLRWRDRILPSQLKTV